VSKHHRTATAKVTAELSIHPEDPVSTKIVRRELQRSNIHCRDAVAKPLITDNKDEKDGLIIIKPVHLRIGNT